jgi:hypothetical protein
MELFHYVYFPLPNTEMQPVHYNGMAAGHECRSSMLNLGAMATRRVEESKRKIFLVEKVATPPRTKYFTSASFGGHCGWGERDFEKAFLLEY